MNYKDPLKKIFTIYVEGEKATKILLENIEFLDVGCSSREVTGNLQYENNPLFIAIILARISMFQGRLGSLSMRKIGR